MNIIEVKNLSKIINDNVILKNITFSLKENEILGIVDKSSMGKSTLIKILAGLYEIDYGDVFIEGKSLKSNKINKNIGTFIDYPYLYEQYTGYKNIKIFSYAFNNKDVLYLNYLIESLELKNELDKKVKFYSLESKIKLAFLISLINKPKILLLDEIFVNLDYNDKEKISNLLKNLRVKYGMSIIITSNNISDVKNICDRVLSMEDMK